MPRFVRFLLPVDPKNIEAAAQAMLATAQKAASDYQARTRQMGGERDWTPDDLRRLDDGSLPGGFAGPNKSFPIGSPADVRDAWGLADLADNPEEVRANIRRIAEQCGWQSALPRA